MLIFLMENFKETFLVFFLHLWHLQGKLSSKL